MYDQIDDGGGDGGGRQQWQRRRWIGSASASLNEKLTHDVDEEMGEKLIKHFFV